MSEFIKLSFAFHAKIDKFVPATHVLHRYHSCFFFSLLSLSLFFFKKSLLSVVEYRHDPRLMFAVIGQSTFSQEIDSFNFATHSPRRAASFSLWKTGIFAPWLNTQGTPGGYIAVIFHLFLFFFLPFPVENPRENSRQDCKVLTWTSRPRLMKRYDLCSHSLSRRRILVELVKNESSRSLNLQSIELDLTLNPKLLAFHN